MTLVLTVCASAVAKADFSGTWILDKSRSEGLPPGMNQTLAIKQASDRIDVEARLAGEQAEQTINDRYILDGKEHDFTPPVINGSAKSGKRTSKWSVDDNGFDVSEAAIVDGEEGEATIKATRRWSLSADGKTLTIEMTIDAPDRTMKSKRVFVKKQ
jgi:hypothetical protein